MRKLTNTNDVEDFLSDTFGIARSEMSAMIFDSVLEAMIRATKESRPSLFCTVSVARAESEYAALIGKSRSELSVTERQRAILNALLETPGITPP